MQILLKLNKVNAWENILLAAKEYISLIVSITVCIRMSAHITNH